MLMNKIILYCHTFGSFMMNWIKYEQRHYHKALKQFTLQHTSESYEELNKHCGVVSKVGIPHLHLGFVPHQGKIFAPNEDGGKNQSSSRDRDEGHGSIFTPFPSPLSHPQLEKNSHRFFFLDFSWINLCNLCIVKLVLHRLVKLSLRLDVKHS